MVNGVAMSNLVRRVQQSVVPTVESNDVVPARRHRNGTIFVESQVVLGIEPKLYLAWSVVPRFWAKGFTLMVFRSTTGFCPQKCPDDLNEHGQMIVEARENSRYEEHPPEGTYYY